MFYQHTEDAHTVAYMAQSQGLHDRCLSRLHGAVTSRKESLKKEKMTSKQCRIQQSLKRHFNMFVRPQGYKQKVFGKRCSVNKIMLVCKETPQVTFNLVFAHCRKEGPTSLLP